MKTRIGRGAGKLALAGWLVLALSGCAHLGPWRPHARTAHFSAVWDGEVDDASVWTLWLSKGLEAHASDLIRSTPKDATDFCAAWPRLSRHDREQVWITLISAIAKYESDFNPSASFDEPPPLEEDSIGLMQLSLSDAKDFHCGFKTESEIEDPRRNLDCAVRILDHLIPSGGLIGGRLETERIGAAFYWAVLNENGHPDSRAFIVGQTNALPFCKD
jgi:hypothetical protein